MPGVAAEPTFPARTGPHRTGRLALDLTDEQRPDPYARREARRRLGVGLVSGLPAAGGAGRKLPARLVARARAAGRR
jgi:hypothetical protein